MRLITKELWRAFPELDRFDDDRCQRFIQSARRGKWAGLGRALLNLFLSTVLFAVILFFAGLALSFLRQRDAQRFDPVDADAIYPTWVILVALAAGAAGVNALVIRDNLLRRRVAKFIHARAKCPQCRYILLGIRVPESLRVNCPECGLELEVDEALTELADPRAPGTSTAGNRSDTLSPSTTPNPDLPPGQPSPPRERRLARAPADRGILPEWLTPKRRKWTLRALLAAIALSVAVPATLWGYNGWFLRAQAQRAAAQRIGLTGIDKISESLNPPPDGHKDAWDYFDLVMDIKPDAQKQVNEASEDLQNFIGLADGADFDYLTDPTVPSLWGDREDTKQASARAELARRYIRRMDELGAWTLLDSLADARRAFRPLPALAPGAPPDFYFQFLTPARQLVTMCVARMALAEGHNDHQEYARALRAGLALARMNRLTPSAISWLVAGASKDSLLARVRSTIATGATPEWLEAIHTVLASPVADDPTPVTAMLDGEREYQRDFTRWFFSDPARVRQGWDKSGFVGGPQRISRTGTLDENLAAINTLRDLLTADASRPPAQRSIAAYQVLSGRPARQSADVLLHALSMNDERRRDAHSTLLILELERFRARRGQFPEQLSDLVPDFLPELPTDPFAPDGMFRYRRVALAHPDAENTVQTFDYLLYSVGLNGTDESGQEVRETNDRTLDANLPHGDHIIHRPPTPASPHAPVPAP